MTIWEIFRPEWMLPDLKSRTKEDLFKEVSDFAIQHFPQLKKDDLVNALWDRERKMTTGIAKNVALPHAYLPRFSRQAGFLGLSRKGIEYHSLDARPVHLVFLLLGDDGDVDAHVLVLKNLAMILTNPEFYPSIVKCTTAKELASSIQRFEELSQFYFS